MLDVDVRAVEFLADDLNCVFDGCSASGRVCWRWGGAGSQGLVVQRAGSAHGPWRTVWPDEPWATRSPSATATNAGGVGGIGGVGGLEEIYEAGVVLPSGDLALAGGLGSGLLVLHADGTTQSTQVADLLREARGTAVPLLADPGGNRAICLSGKTAVALVGREEPCLGHFVVAPRVASDQRPRPRQPARPSGSRTGGPARPGSSSGST